MTNEHRAHRLGRTVAVLVPAFLLAACGAPQPDATPADEREVVQQGAAMLDADHHDVSAPLDLMPVAARQPRVEHEVKKLPMVRRGPRNQDPVVQSIESALTLLAPTAGVQFDGVGQGLTGPQGTFSVASAPPDTNGDVGPNHYVQTVNTDFAVFSKTGTVLYGPVPINTLWSGFGGGCQTANDGDPVVLYDPMADRWIISQFQVTTQPFQQCIAVSQTPDPTGAYNRYAFSYSDGFPDYPKMGVWPDAYYTTFNMFNNAGTAYLYAKVCAYDRAKMLTGAAATQQCFNTTSSFGGLLPADLDGSRQPPAGAPNYVVGLGTTTTTLAYWKFHVDWTTPASSTFTGPTTLTVPSYTEACGASGTCIPQSGGGSLDSLSDRLMFRLAYRNQANGTQSLVVNHSVTAGTAVGVRWYELRADSANNLSVFQSGTYAPDTTYRWMGSAAMDQAGNIALGFSGSSSALKPSLRYTGRLAGDAAGTMTQGENIMITGAGAQGSSLTRWGDYSMLGVDPSDDCTFWFTSEYIPANGTFNWKTRIGSFKLPGCGVVGNDFGMSASPATVAVAAGGSGTTTVGTTLTSGTAETVTFSASGLPAGASASFSPASVTAGGSSTLTLNAGTAAAGSYTVTVTGTAASATHTTTVTFSVAAAPDFSIAITPTSRSVVVGTSTTYTVSTTAIGGSTQSITLSVSGLPAGASGSFSPATVTAGGSSTLTVTTSAVAAATTFTVTGASTTTHSATASLTVTAAPAPDYTVAISPSSATVTQGGSATYTVSTTALNGSTQSIALTISALPTGVTATFSPATVTAGGSSTLTLATSATATTGTASFTVTGTSGTTTRTASGSLTVNATSGVTPLTSGVPVTGISGASGSQQFWSINVPSGTTTLTVQISGGTGDADLYVRQGAQPTTTTYTCRPFLSGNNETCTISAPVAGLYYIMIRGFSAYSGVTLVATNTTSTVPSLTNGVAVTGIAGASGSNQFWKLAVPAGKTTLTFTISGGTGDADLYVRQGAQPTTTTYNCRPFLNGNNETCTFSAPAAADWYVMIRGFSAYSGVTLKGTYSP